MSPQALPGLEFQPSDPDRRRAPASTRGEPKPHCTNIRPAIALDAAAEDVADLARGRRAVHQHDPHRALGGCRRPRCAALHRCCRADGLLYLYGPFRRDGAHTAPSNAAFDRSLRGQNPDWGVRDLEAVAALAVAHGFAAPIVEEMPANNLSLIFRLRAARL